MRLKIYIGSGRKKDTMAMLEYNERSADLMYRLWSENSYPGKAIRTKISRYDYQTTQNCLHGYLDLFNKQQPLVRLFEVKVSRRKARSIVRLEDAMVKYYECPSITEKKETYDGWHYCENYIDDIDIALLKGKVVVALIDVPHKNRMGIYLIENGKLKNAVVPL